MDTVVAIPSFLSCDYKKPCISCETLDTFVTEFRQRFPGMMAPYTDSIVTVQQADQNQLLTRFLNYRTGFSATAGEYLAAYRSCHSGNPPAGAALCLFAKALNDPSGFIEPDTTTCDNAKTMAAFMAHQLFIKRRDSLLADFESRYKAQCLEAKYSETFYVRYQPMEYHYTLYYYAQGGNLLKTLPPAAVMPNYSQAFLDSVATARNAGTAKMNYKNNEAMATQYRYNTLNQVSLQESPDGGLSKFWYDRLGRLAISQNEKQTGGGKYSYTLYDYLGRITEVGQAAQGTAMTQTISRDTTALKNWIAAAATEQITGTVYDEKYTPLETIDNGKSVLFQKNLRSRVSYTYVKPLEATTFWDAATFYSYDILGNVDTLLQDYKSGMGVINCLDNPQEPSGNRFKKIVYNYDLISGKVNEVSYQPGMRDAFYHQYYYDAENRLTEVKTSKDKIFWERDAAYEYYRHGPLSRMVLGAQWVQGVDYAYTLQGWLKGINSSNPTPPTVSLGLGDMGRDGYAVGDMYARDAFGLVLSYYQNDVLGITDYKPIGASASIKPFASTGSERIGLKSMYNGNIAAIAVNLPKIGAPLLFSYRYDQLNRIVNQYAFNGLDSTTNNWNAQALLDYGESVTYDPNGNILAYKRNGDASRSNASITGMDNLTYTYTPNKNQLSSVQDDAPDALANEYGRYNDIRKDKTYNYEYDAIGNMVSNTGEGISNIEWNVYGKIKSITKAGANISYTYDASGNRISKTVNGKATYYVRDASGNVMSVYEMKDTLRQKEINLFGSSRLGIYKVDVDVQTCNTVSPEVFTLTRGNKLFELSNHLGNVLAIISDKRIQHSANGSTVDYYSAGVRSAQNYYPFGMMMPGIPGNPGSPAETAAVPDSLLEEDNYDSGIGGWEVYNPCTIVNDNGRVKVSTDQVWGTALKKLNVKKGRHYRIRFKLDMGNCGQLNIPVYHQPTATYVVMPETGISLTQSGSYEGTFTATADLVNLLFEVVPGGGNPTPDSTAYFWIDNFSIEEIHPLYELVSRNRWTIVRQDSDPIKVISSQAWGEASKVLKVKSGKQYRLRYTVDMGNLYPMHVIIYNPADGSYVYPAETGLSIYNSGEKMGTFTAAADSLELRFQLVSIPAGADSVYCWLDNISVDEIVPYQEGGEGHENRGEYRYGFNGKELDKETSSTTTYDYGFRIYSPALGRFLSVDPLAKSYPWNSPYSYAEGDVIRAVDLDGLEKVIVHTVSFAPFNFFGRDPWGTYGGDGNNRKFGDNLTSTVVNNTTMTNWRIRSEAALDLATMKTTSQPQAIGSMSHYYADPPNPFTIPLRSSKTAYSNASFEGPFYAGPVAGYEGSTLGLDYHLVGGNSAAPFGAGAKIDVNVKINFWKTDKEGEIGVNGTVVGDKFPSNENYLVDEHNNKLFLGVSGLNSPNPDNAPYTELPKNNKRPMSSFYMTILFNKDNSFKGVRTPSGTEFSLADWTKKFTSQNPQSKQTGTAVGETTDKKDDFVPDRY